MRKVECGMGKSECGLRPAGTKGAYAPEGNRKAELRKGCKLVYWIDEWLI
jgi:hypothetical protein